MRVNGLHCPFQGWEAVGAGRKRAFTLLCGNADLMLVCGRWLGLRLATSGREVVLHLPTSGMEVGWRVPTCGDYERRIFFLPLVLFFPPHRHNTPPPPAWDPCCFLLRQWTMGLVRHDGHRCDRMATHNRAPATRMPTPSTRVDTHAQPCACDENAHSLHEGGYPCPPSAIPPLASATPAPLCDALNNANRRVELATLAVTTGRVWSAGGCERGCVPSHRGEALVQGDAGTYPWHYPPPPFPLARAAVQKAMG